MGAGISPCFKPFSTGNQKVTIYIYSCLHVAMKLFQHLNQLRTSKVPKYDPQSTTVHSIEGLIQVNKYLIQWYSFDTLLHKLSGREDHVHSTPSRSKTTMTLGQIYFIRRFGPWRRLFLQLQANVCLGSHRSLSWDPCLYKEAA